MVLNIGNEYSACTVRGLECQAGKGSEFAKQLEVPYVSELVQSSKG